MTAALLGTLERVAPAVVPFAPFLGAVAHVEVQATPETEAIADRHRPDRTADVLIELLRAVRPGPLAIVVEDAQWVDESTAHILGRLASATAVQPWLLIVTRRDSDGGFTPSEGERILVGPLDDETVREFAKLATEATPLRPHELDRIVAQAAGSPLFVEEMSRTVRTVGSLQAVPESINAAIAAQVDALAPPARRVLGYAAVLGRSFRRHVLFELMHADGFELDEATRVELGRFFDRDGDESRLRFRNGLVRDVVYEGMAYRTRARLHGIAADILERISDDADADADMLAHHFWQAGDARVPGTTRGGPPTGPAGARQRRGRDAARPRARRGAACPRSPPPNSSTACCSSVMSRDRAGLLEDALDAYGNAAALVAGRPGAAGGTAPPAGAHPRAGGVVSRSRSAPPRWPARSSTGPDGGAPTGAGRTRWRSPPSSGSVRSTSTRRCDSPRRRWRRVGGQPPPRPGAGQQRDLVGGDDARPLRCRRLGPTIAGACTRRPATSTARPISPTTSAIQAYFEGRWADDTRAVPAGRGTPTCGSATSSTPRPRTPTSARCSSTRVGWTRPSRFCARRAVCCGRPATGRRGVRRDAPGPPARRRGDVRGGGGGAHRGTRPVRGDGPGRVGVRDVAPPRRLPDPDGASR